MSDNQSAPENMYVTENTMSPRREREREAVKKYICDFLSVANPLKSGISALRMMAAIFGFITVMSFIGHPLIMGAVGAAFLFVVFWGWGRVIDIKTAYRHFGILALMFTSLFLLSLARISVDIFIGSIIVYIFTLAVGFCYRLYIVEPQILSGRRQAPSKKATKIGFIIVGFIPGILMLLRPMIRHYLYGPYYFVFIIMAFCFFFGYGGIISIHKYLLIEKYKLVLDKPSNIGSLKEVTTEGNNTPVESDKNDIVISE